jgi:ferritin-like metal-binding protein YciE
MKDFYALFAEELCKMYNCGRHVIKALPYMIEAASSARLKKVLKYHLKEAVLQSERLKEIASEFDEKLTICDNTPIKHVLTECKKALKNCHDWATKDAAIIIYMQKIQHYEIASYGSLKAFAKHFKLDHVHELLEESSLEEGNLDKKLIDLAEGTVFDVGINAKARRRCA